MCVHVRICACVYLLVLSNKAFVFTTCYIMLKSISQPFQDAQEAHGVAVPTPSVPDSFEDKLPAGKMIIEMDAHHIYYLHIISYCSLSYLTVKS